MKDVSLVEYKKLATCANCSDWVGRCLKGKKNCIAADVACSDFTEKEMMTLRYCH
jgi:hypothetical protein